MIVKILGNINTPAVAETDRLIRQLGHAVWDDSYYYCDLAVAPRLTRKLHNDELSDPRLGTLIFHPSPLPYGRGMQSIKWAYKRKEPITAATWFWADMGLDTGDICEQEIIKIDYSMPPRDFYRAHVMPALIRTLERCLNNLQKGYIRRIPQIEAYSSFDFSEKKEK